MEREPNPTRDEPPTQPVENTVAPDRHPVRDPAQRPPTEPSGDPPADTEARDDGPLSDSPGGPRSPGTIPPQVAERFLRVDNEYYFPDRTLAFIDHGTKLTSRTNNAEVVRSLVAIAEARGWTSLRVTGAAEFRRQVWREATLRGLDVRGYDPNDVEREDVRRAAERQGAARTDQEHRDPAAPGDGQDREAPADQSPDAQPTRIKGHLVEAGPAPYKFDPKNGLSYYVKLHTDEGERVLWGVDLERALAESSSRVAHGDAVIVQSTGSRPVTLKVPKHDSAGRTTGTQSIQTRRNGWIIEKPAYFAQSAERAHAFRNGSDASSPSKPDAELAKARLSLWLGEQFAATRIDSAADRAQFMAFLREALARTLERGEDVPAPRLTPEAAARLRRQQQEPQRVAAHAEEPSRAEPEREVPPHARA